jgi:hypothetical protein
MPVEIAEVLGEKIDARHSEMTRGRCGSDGRRIILFHLWFMHQIPLEQQELFLLGFRFSFAQTVSQYRRLYGLGVDVAFPGGVDSMVSV